MSCRVLRLNKVVVESTCSNRLDCINIKESWNETLYLFSSLNFYVINIAIDRDRVTDIAEVNHEEDPTVFYSLAFCIEGVWQ